MWHPNCLLLTGQQQNAKQKYREESLFSPLQSPEWANHSDCAPSTGGHYEGAGASGTGADDQANQMFKPFRRQLLRFVSERRVVEILCKTIIFNFLKVNVPVFSSLSQKQHCGPMKTCLNLTSNTETFSNLLTYSTWPSEIERIERPKDTVVIVAH